MPMEIEHSTRRRAQQVPVRDLSGANGSTQPRWVTTRVGTHNAPFNFAGMEPPIGIETRGGVWLSDAETKRFRKQLQRENPRRKVIVYRRGVPVDLDGLSAAETLPAGKTQGLKISLVGMSPSRAPSLNELSALLLPLARSYQYEVLGTPTYVVDDNPVWSWKYDQAAGLWQSVVASGPFAGAEGDTISFSDQNARPTLAHTSALPKSVFSWAVTLRPTNLELPEAKVGIMREAVRNALSVFRNLGSAITTSAKVVAVDAPAKPNTVAKAVGSAALIGIALTLLSTAAGK